jgi:hypothetical protein
VTNQTVAILRAEASRLRDMADRCDALADDFSKDQVSSNGKQSTTNGRSVTPSSSHSKTGEYSGLTQREAIIKALSHGPQTTREIYNRIIAGGLEIKKPTYITALLPRIKNQVERDDQGRVRLKTTL